MVNYMKYSMFTVFTILLSLKIYSQGGVAISNSGNNPNPSAMLDVQSSNKGILIPRVPLTSTTDGVTITNGNVVSLLVYNTNTQNDIVPGYYYWDGTVWKTMGGGNDADADPLNEIQDLQLAGNDLTITDNGTPTTIDLSPYLDNTDEQNIDSVSLNGTTLTVFIENGASSSVDLASIISDPDHDWYEVGGNTAPDNINDDIYTQGNVGIGTVTPTFKLETAGANSDALINEVRVGKGNGDIATNTVVGRDALISNTTGYENVSIGDKSLRSNTTGFANVSLGESSLFSNTTGFRNVAIGGAAMQSNTTGGNNTAVGYEALLRNTIGGTNTSVGFYSLRANTIGNGNTAIGNHSMYINNTGTNNTALGSNSLRFNDVGSNNLSLGVNSLYNNKSGQFNTATGMSSLNDNVSGNSNTALGHLALANSLGSFNTAVGKGSGSALISGDKNIIIGSSIELPILNGSNQLNIGNIIYGVNIDGINNTLSSGNIGIGDIIPIHKLEVAGDVAIGSDNALKATLFTRDVIGGDIKGTDLIVRAGSSTGSGNAGQIQIFPGTESNIGGTLLNREDVSKGLYLEYQKTNWNAHPNLFRLNAVLGSSSAEGNLSGLGSTGTVLTIDGSSSGGSSALEIVGTNNLGNGDQGFIRFFGSSEKNPFATIIANMTGVDKSSGGLKFNTYNLGVENTSMAITSTGNVGIGTIATLNKLHVIGGAAPIRAERDGVDSWYWGINATRMNFTNSTTGIAPITFERTGLVGIGTATPTESLHVVGNILASGTITPSDLRYKTDVKTLESALNNVLNMRGVSYQMKKECKDKGFGEGIQIGVIAQEVEKIYPQLINTSKDGYKGVDYSKFTPILIQAIKEQQAIIESQKEKINVLETTSASIEKVEDLQSQINELKALIGTSEK